MVCGNSVRIYVIDRYDRPAFIEALKQSYNFFICHWGALRLRDTEAPIRRTRWFHVIADECHRAQSRKALQTRALKQLKPTYKTGASGSFASNKPDNAWSVLHWLYPKQFTSFWKFVQTYCEQQEVHNERTGQIFRKIVGVKEEMLPVLHRQMAPFYMRRLKSDVWQDMPPKTYSRIEVDLLPRQQKAYQTMKKHMLSWVGEHEDQELSAPVVIAQLVRLQQFALASPNVTWITKKNRQTGKDEKFMKVVLEEPSSKLDALVEIIEDNENEQHVVFSQSRSMIDITATRLAKKGLRVGKYTGTVPQQERDFNVELFQKGKLDILCATIAAGGESITLTASSTCHFLDRHWSPSRNVQAEDRLHRIGQTQPVQIIDYVAKNTIDLGRLQQISAKLATLKLLLGDKPEPEKYLNIVRAGG